MVPAGRLPLAFSAQASSSALEFSGSAMVLMSRKSPACRCRKAVASGLTRATAPPRSVLKKLAAYRLFIGSVFEGVG